MKPVHERNQECLPPKKRDHPVNNSSSSGSNSVTGGGGGGLGGGGGGDDIARTQSSGAGGGDAQGGGGASDWLHVPSGLHYSVQGAGGMAGVPADQYGMLYKVALPSVTYSQTSLHPVLSHISPAYTVPSSLLQHPGIPYPPLGYAQIPHSSLQFLSSPYGAVPYAVPPGFVPGSLISPPGAIPQSHLVPYPSVLQEGVGSPPPPQVQVSAYAKAAAAGVVPLMLSSEQAAQQHLGAADLGHRGVPVFYHPQGARAAGGGARDPHGREQEEREVNGGEREQGAKEMLQDSVYAARGMRLLQALSGSAPSEHGQDRSLKSRRLDERASPGQRSTPDIDLEVQQVVGRLASPVHGGCGSRKEVSFAPLNLSQGSQRGREAQSYPDPRVTSLPPHAGQPMGSIILANGQPVLVPLEYHPHHQQQQHYPGPAHDAPPPAAMAPLTPYTKPPDPPGRVGLPDRPSVETTVPQQQQQQHPHPPSSTQQPPAPQAPPPAPGPPSASSNPSHFMKGAIIQLATGELKRVEDLQTQDFVRSAEASGGLKIDSSMVVEVRASQARPGLVALGFTVGEQQNKVAIDVPPEHPFFVFGQGWSSCSPERTAQLYGLACHALQVGDMCVSITLQPPPAQPSLAPQQPQRQTPHHHHHHQQQQQAPVRTSTKANSGPAPQPMGPPAPQLPRPPPHFRPHRERERGAEETAPAAGNEAHTRTNRTAAVGAEHARSQSGYYLHTEAAVRAGPHPGGAASAASAAARRWSAPGLQRYAVKGEEGGAGAHPQLGGGPPGAVRPSFIPQEVKLSIEGRSNAGK